MTTDDDIPAADAQAISFTFIRASGPGGQNVNKVSTAAQLRFDTQLAASLSEAVRDRLLQLAGSRATAEGEIIITAQRYRTQEMNRADALARLAALLRAARETQKPRRPTRPGKAARQRRLDSKSRRGALKALRGKPD